MDNRNLLKIKGGILFPLSLAHVVVTFDFIPVRDPLIG